MLSPRFQQLKERVNKHQLALLPNISGESAVVALSDTLIIQTLAYRVMCHAEIEAYFEDRVLVLSRQALVKWRDERKVCATLTALLAFSGREHKYPPATLAPEQSSQARMWSERISASERILIAVSDYNRRIIEENHGIRERNILSMLLPVGVEPHEIDSIMLAELDEFGRRRGEAAHQSTGRHVQRAIDPVDERDKVNNIIGLLEGIDIKLSEIEATI